jgi:hypothetical protein
LAAALAVESSAGRAAQSHSKARSSIDAKCRSPQISSGSREGAEQRGARS